MIGSQTEFGSCENLIGNATIENDEITKNYDITYVNGTLTVNKREILVTSNTASWVYDAEIHSDSGFTVKDNEGDPDDAIASGQLAKVVEYPSVKYVADSGIENNVIKIVVLASDSENAADVSDNYVINYEYGDLTVKQREISIITESRSWIYDGKDHYCDEFSYTNGSLELVEGHTLNFKKNYVTVNAFTPESVENILDIDSITDEDGVDVSENYKIPTTADGSLSYGLLQVKKRQITVTTADNEWVYNAEAHYDLGFVIADDENDPDDYLAEGQSANVVYFSTVSLVKDTVEGNNVLEINVTDVSGADTTGNYGIKYDYGTLTVLPRPISVITASNSWVYDGYEHIEVGFRYADDSEYTLVDGDGIEFDESEYTVLKEFTDGLRDNVQSVKRIVDVYGNDVSDNYVIPKHEEGTLSYGNVEITKRHITVVSNDNEWYYDGELHSDSGFFVVDDYFDPDDYLADAIFY